MTNEQAQLIINESIRPRCEQIRALKANLENDLALLSGEGGTFFDVSNGGVGSTYTDLRGNTVPLLLTAADVVDIRAKIIGLLNVLQAASAMDSINRACVRPLNSN
jgi:hypothetical protein